MLISFFVAQEEIFAFAIYNITSVSRRFFYCKHRGMVMYLVCDIGIFEKIVDVGHTELRLPRDFVLLEFWQELFVVQESRDYFGVRECSGERVVRLRLLGNAAVIEDRVEIECAAMMLGIDGGVYSPLYHMHPGERVGIDGAMCKRPRRVPCSLARIAHKIAVE